MSFHCWTKVTLSGPLDAVKKARNALDATKSANGAFPFQVDVLMAEELKAIDMKIDRRTYESELKQIVPMSPGVHAFTLEMDVSYTTCEPFAEWLSARNPTLDVACTTQTEAQRYPERSKYKAGNKIPKPPRPEAERQPYYRETSYGRPNRTAEVPPATPGVMMRNGVAIRIAG